MGPRPGRHLARRRADGPLPQAGGGAGVVAVPSLAEHEDLASLVDSDFQGLRRSPCFFADDPQGFFP